MRVVLLLCLTGFIASGCGSSAPSQGGAGGAQADSVSTPVTTAPIKQSVTCTTAGTDGYMNTYSIQYQFDTHTDGVQIASCAVKKGYVRNLKCLSSDAMSITYVVTALSTGLHPVPYDFSKSETFNLNASNCMVVNF